MLADCGLPCEDEGFPCPVVRDFEAMEIPCLVPVFWRHERTQELGSAVAKVVNGRLEAAGVFKLPAMKIVRCALEGDFWQVSTGIKCNRNDMEFVETGEFARVNGRSFGGPLLIVRAGRLFELSVTENGGSIDQYTYLVVAGTPEFSLCGRGPLPTRQRLIQALKAYEAELRAGAAVEADMAAFLEQARATAAAERRQRQIEQADRERSEQAIREANAARFIIASARERQRQRTLTY
jgi:hypothetical protein